MHVRARICGSGWRERRYIEDRAMIHHRLGGKEKGKEERKRDRKKMMKKKK
jgi:hypothetical protein